MQDHKQIVALLEYVRYELLPGIQQCSVKFMRILRYVLLVVWRFTGHLTIEHD